MCVNCLGTKRRIRRVEELDAGQKFGMTTCECHPDFATTQEVPMVRREPAEPALPVVPALQRSTDELIAVCRKAGLNEIADRLHKLQRHANLVQARNDNVDHLRQEVHRLQERDKTLTFAAIRTQDHIRELQAELVTLRAMVAK